MNYEQRWEMQYEVLMDGSWERRFCYPCSEEKKNQNLEMLREKKNMRLVSCKKLYPFNMEKNQHNFELISNICFNRMRDMESGEIEFNQTEYDRLEALKEKADRLFCMMNAPITWMVWEDLKDAKELSEMAINHRMMACIENGRPDLVMYCE